MESGKRAPGASKEQDRLCSLTWIVSLWVSSFSHFQERKDLQSYASFKNQMIIGSLVRVILIK